MKNSVRKREVIEHDHHSHHHHDHDHHHEHIHNENHDHGSNCCISAPQVLTSLGGSVVVGDGLRTDIRIMQMDCPVEENLIQKKLGNMSDVKELDFNLMQRVLTVTHTSDSLDTILAAIRSLGFEPEISDNETARSPLVEKKKSLWPLMLAGVFALAAEALNWVNMYEWLEAGLALLAVVLCGATTYKKGWISIKNGDFNINALMSIAVTGALLLKVWPEAAMVMVLFTIAELIEAKSLDRARNAIGSLMELTPDTSMVQQADGSWSEVDASTVQPGSLVRVKPGERIGLDGEIVKGQTAINQAPITGESMPVDKSVGDAVFAGTINQTGSFDYKVTAASSNTTLARIIHAVQEAQGAKAPMQRFVERFSRIYTPVVMIIALAVAVLPPLFALGGWEEWIYKALVILVIACPCALVISTPVTLVSGLTAAARKGILVKGGVYLEQGRKLTSLALDKTGTITNGKPALIDVMAFGHWSEQFVQTTAASLASNSDHPVSQAITDASVDMNKREVDNFKAIIGRGVYGTIDNQAFYLGNLRLTEEHFNCPVEITETVKRFENQGKTVILLNDGTQVLGLFAVADTVKEISREAISQLHNLGIKTLMLTGDNSYTAKAIAAQVGIDDVRGGLLPEDKHRVVEEYSRTGISGMVGDGINDAPALAAADIGFAMGTMGTDTAIETADVALMDDDLRKIPTFVNLSRKTYALLIQNISLALGIKAVFLALTIAGMGTMWMAVFADVGASLLVVANGLRLLRK